MNRDGKKCCLPNELQEGTGCAGHGSKCSEEQRVACRTE